MIDQGKDESVSSNIKRICYDKGIFKDDVMFKFLVTYLKRLQFFLINAKANKYLVVREYFNFSLPKLVF